MAPEQKVSKSIRRIPNIHGLGAVTVAVLMTVLVTTLAWYGRYLLPPMPSFQISDLTLFVRNPYWLGYTLQTSLIPIALLYFFSHTQLFQRIISDEISPADDTSLISALVTFQLLTLGFEIILAHSDISKPTGIGMGEFPNYTLLIPVVASLLGGWRAGLIVGLNTLWVRGTHDFLFHTAHFSLYRYETPDIWLAGVSWPKAVLENYIINAWAIMPVWAGVVAGVIAARLGRRRFSPLAMLGIMAVVYIGAGILTIINRGGQTAIVWLPTTLIDGSGLLAVGLMISSARSKLAQRKTEVAELALARAELQALRAQINPHFLFNALNTIRYLVRTDPSAARQLLLDLSQILQRALRSDQFVSLRDELDYVRACLALEKARFNDRLQVRWTLPSEKVLNYLVPVLILQPLVENAVLHGISPQPSGGLIHISIRQQNETLLLEVADNGRGMDPGQLEGIFSPKTTDSHTSGVGLPNIDGRLRALYGDRYRLSIQSQIGQGTLAQIVIPIRGEQEG